MKMFEIEYNKNGAVSSAEIREAQKVLNRFISALANETEQDRIKRHKRERIACRRKRILFLLCVFITISIVIGLLMKPVCSKYTVMVYNNTAFYLFYT
jgi:phosphopantetheinyl transferase